MIVVDTNVIAYLLITGDETEAARAALMSDAEWAAPMSWRSEFRNVLASYIRRRHLTVAEAIIVQHTAEEIVEGREYAVDSGEVLMLAAESGRSAYDCEFVALARALNVPFVTSDRQLFASFPDVAVALRTLTDGT